MIPQPPPGQGPIDPRGAFSPPPPPQMGAGNWQTSLPGGGSAPPGMSYGPPPQLPPMPPMPPMYPPMMMPPPPPPRGGGFVRAIFVTLATTLFGLSLTLNIYLLVVSGLFGGGSSARSSNLVDGEPTQKVAVIPVKGVIMDDASAQFDRFLKQVEADKNVKAIVLDVDSPGGSVTASDEISNRLRRFKAKRPGVPVVVSMGSLAASGGYYVSCGADYLFAQPSTLTGNIGVLLPQYNVHELFEKWGIKETTITSDGAPFKNAGSMFQPERAEDRAYLQDIADKAFTQFKDVVAKGRQGKLRKPLSEIANGKIYVAADAKLLGLVDDVGYLHDAYEYAARQANLSKPTVVRYQTPPSLLEAMLSGRSSAGRTAAGSVQINGINVNAADLHEMTTPRLMYLWRGQ
jgi:protease-4